MTNKERIIAAIKGESTDRLPFIPRLDLWYKANKKNNSLPDKYKKASLKEILDDLNLGYHHVVPDFLDFVDPLDEVDRALGLYRLRTMAYRPILRGIKRNVKYEGDITTVQYLTPYGNIQTKVLYNEDMKKAGITITHILEYAIKTIDDFEAIAYIYENIEIQPAYDQYLIAQEEIGNRGVTVAYSTIAGSPMHLIQRELMPYEQFFYTYYEHLDKLEWLASKINVYFDKLINVVSNSPAELILLGANYDINITWPPYFQKHITPCLSAAAKILHNAGKYLLTHTDGENKGLLDEYLNSDIDVADSICPAPMTKLTLHEVMKAFAEKITIWGGIPSVVTLENSMKEKDYEKYLNNLFSNIGDGKRLILSIADTTPPGTNLNRIIKIDKLAEQFSPVV